MMTTNRGDATGADDPIRTFPDATLARMTERAWYEACRAWGEYRAAIAGQQDDMVPMLRADAGSADDHWRHLRAEQVRRETDSAASAAESEVA